MLLHNHILEMLFSYICYCIENLEHTLFLQVPSGKLHLEKAPMLVDRQSGDEPNTQTTCSMPKTVRRALHCTVPTGPLNRHRVPLSGRHYSLPRLSGGDGIHPRLVARMLQGHAAWSSGG